MQYGNEIRKRESFSPPSMYIFFVCFHKNSAYRERRSINIDRGALPCDSTDVWNSFHITHCVTAAAAAVASSSFASSFFVVFCFVSLSPLSLSYSFHP
jgi:hypothetical protein